MIKDTLALLGKLAYDITDKMLISSWLQGGDLKMTSHTEKIIYDLEMKGKYEDYLISHIQSMPKEDIKYISNHDIYFIDPVMMKEKLLLLY